MRITENMRYESVLRDISRAQQRMLKAQEQVSTGKKVNKPSDDPIATTDILRINGDKAEDIQYSRNLTFARSKLQATDAKLDTIEQMTERVLTLAQLSVSDPSKATPYLTEIQGLRDQMISAANATYAGRFIFGGSETTQPPYVKGTGAVVTYAGNSEDMPLQISRSVKVPTQIPGSDLFSGAVDIFAVMDDLATAIQAQDRDGINAQMSKLQDFADTISLARSKVGGYLNLTTNVESDLSAAKLAYETELTNKEAADLAAAITEITVSQNSLQATLAVGAHISQISLLDYLK
jgi:flagellar hook-associated protein 3 FlgL